MSLEAVERRAAILNLLGNKRHETIKNLADLFGVSERTIRRDIEILSYTEPIYTQAGKYGGGVYVIDTYHLNRVYFKDCESAVLKKLLLWAEQDNQCGLTMDEIIILKQLIAEHTRFAVTN